MGHFSLHNYVATCRHTMTDDGRSSCTEFSVLFRDDALGVRKAVNVGFRSGELNMYSEGEAVLCCLQRLVCDIRS